MLSTHTYLPPAVLRSDGLGCWQHFPHIASTSPCQVAYDRDEHPVCGKPLASWGHVIDRPFGLRLAVKSPRIRNVRSRAVSCRAP